MRKRETVARSLVFINFCPPPTLQWTYGQSMRERGVCVHVQRRRGRKGKGWEARVGEGSREREKGGREKVPENTAVPSFPVVRFSSPGVCLELPQPSPFCCLLSLEAQAGRRGGSSEGHLRGSGLRCWVAFLYSFRSQIMHLWSFPSYLHVKLEKEHVSFLLVPYGLRSHLSDTPEYSTTASQRGTTPRMLHL